MITLPSLQVVLSSASSSYALKNEGVRAAAADIVAILDADCIPDPGWLRHLMDTMRDHPDVVAVSGKTVYAGDCRPNRFWLCFHAPIWTQVAPEEHVSSQTTMRDFGVRSFLPILCQRLAAPLPPGSNPRPSSAAVDGYSSSLVYRWCTTLQGGPWRGICDVTLGTAPLLHVCVTARCLTPGWPA